MALFNESLEGRFNRLIARLHSTKGSPPAPQISPEISHSITLENDRPEQLIHQDTSLWAIRLSLAAVAANFAHVGIRNPLGSGMLLVVTDVSVSNAALVAQLVHLRIGLQSSDVGFTTAGLFFRDLRRGVAGNAPGLSIVIQSVSQFGNGPVEVQQLAAGQGDAPFASTPYILPPGTDLLLTPSVVNQALDADFAGYARPLGSADLL